MVSGRHRLRGQLGRPACFPAPSRAVVDAFRAHPEAVAVYPDWASIDARGAVLREERLDDYDIGNMLLNLNWGIGPGAFFKRDALARVGPRNPRYTYCGDMEFWLRMAQHGPLVHVPKVLATHRVHGDSASVSARGARMANEWFEVFRTTLRSPALPQVVKAERFRILRDAARHARLHYCGLDRRCKLRFRALALAYGALARSFRTFEALARAPARTASRLGAIAGWIRRAQFLFRQRRAAARRARHPEPEEPYQPALHRALCILHAFPAADVVRTGGRDRAAACGPAAGNVLPGDSAGVRRSKTARLHWRTSGQATTIFRPSGGCRIRVDPIASGS